MNNGVKRFISLMLEDGTNEELQLIKEYCKNKNIEFKFRYQRKDSFSERDFNDNNIDRLYYFYIVGNTNDYNQFYEYFREKIYFKDYNKNKVCRIYLTDFAEICNIADMDDSFEENLKECLNDCKKLQNMKEIINNKFLKFIMPIENVKVLEEFRKYYCYMNETQIKMIRDRIDILNNNREVIDEEFTDSILSLHNNVKALREKTGMNRKEFCNYFEIPYRTVEDWENKKSTCSNYLFKLMKEKLEQNKLI